MYMLAFWIQINRKTSNILFGDAYTNFVFGSQYCLQYMYIIAGRN